MEPGLGEVRAAIAELDRQRHGLDTILLTLVRASVTGGDGADPGRETRQWMQAALRQTAAQARASVLDAAGRTLDKLPVPAR